MKKILCLLLLIPFIAGYTQPPFNNLRECIEYSKQNNASLKIDQLSAQISHEKLKAAWSVLLPQVKAFGTLDNNLSLPVQLVPAQLFGGPEGEYAKLKFGTKYNATFGVEATLSLINVSNWKNIKSTDLAEEASLYQAKDKALTITEQIITSYYFALLSREAIVLNKDLVNSGDSLLSAAAVRLSNGLIEPLEYNRVRSIYLESVQQLYESEGAYVKNINSLKSLMGLHDKDTLILQERITALMQQNQSPSSLNLKSHQLPRHRMLTAKAFQAKTDLERSRSKIFPELSMYARASRQSFSNEFNFRSADQPWFDVAALGMRAEWSLFTGFNRQSNIRQSSLQNQAARYELENYTLQAEKELEELRLNHEIAARGVGRYNEHYELNLRNHRIAGEKYKEGIYTIDQYVTIYQEMVRSQNQYLNKLASFLVYESIVQSRNTLP